MTFFAPKGTLHRTLNSLGNVLIAFAGYTLIIVIPLGWVGFIFESVWDAIAKPLLLLIAWSLGGALFVVIPLKWLGELFLKWDFDFREGIRDKKQND